MCIHWKKIMHKIPPLSDDEHKHGYVLFSTFPAYDHGIATAHTPAPARPVAGVPARPSRPRPLAL